MSNVREVEKQTGGSLEVTLKSGETFVISPEDELFQVFVIFTMLQ